MRLPGWKPRPAAQLAQADLLASGRVVECPGSAVLLVAGSSEDKLGVQLLDCQAVLFWLWQAAV